MSGLFQRTLTRLGHLSDDSISKLINGELGSMREIRVRSHLANCWQCRARRDVLERAALQVVEYRKHHVERRQPLDPYRRDLFLRRLDEVLEEVSAASWKTRLLSGTHFSIPCVTTPKPVGFAFLAAFALILFFWQRHVPTVSANVLLEKAVQAEVRQSNRGMPGVICQKIEIKTKSRTVERSLYRDSARKRTPRAVRLTPDEQIVRHELETAGVDWQEPLSAARFLQWYDRLPQKTADVKNVNSDVLMLVAIRRRQMSASPHSRCVRPTSTRSRAES
jgi:hypothetical protein